MKLRRRLTLVLLTTAVPLVAGMVWLRSEIEQRAMDRAVRELTLARVEAAGQERCEAATNALELGPPMMQRAWRPFREDRPAPGGNPPPGDGPPPGAAPPPGPGRPPFGMGFRVGLVAYDAAFRSKSPQPIPFPEPLRARLAAGADWASTIVGEGDERAHYVALRTRWPDGGCAYVLARGPARWRGARGIGFVTSAIALCAALVAAVWIAAGPPIRRIRALAREVGSAAGRRYAHAVPVEGDDEIAELARAFNAAGAEVRAHLTQVERREEALRSFLAHTTHDVMIPLTVLQGHLAALRRALDGGQPIHERDVAAAAEEAAHLGALVHNLSAVAKLEAGEGIVRADPVDLSALVERVVERHRPLARPRDVSLAFAVPPDAPVTVLGDMTLLEQAIGNAIANAVRYNAAGGHVAVSLETLRGEPGRFRVRIVDDGPGVSDADLARLGERGFRGRAGLEQHRDGQGLGLHIARTVAERHRFALHFAAPAEGGLEVQLEGPVVDPTRVTSAT